MSGSVILLFLQDVFQGILKMQASLNSLVWVRCPKHKWHGRNRIELATASAALYFNGRATVKHEVRARTGLAVGVHT